MTHPHSSRVRLGFAMTLAFFPAVSIPIFIKMHVAPFFPALWRGPSSIKRVTSLWLMASTSAARSITSSRNS